MGIHYRPELPIGHPDSFIVLPDLRAIGESRQRGRGCREELHVNGVEIPPHDTVLHGSRGLYSTLVHRIYAEQLADFLFEFGTRLAPAVLHSRQIRYGQDMNASRDHLGPEEFQYALARTRHLLPDAHIARQDDDPEVGIGAVGQLLKPHDEVRFVTQPLQSSGFLLHLVLEPAILRIGGIIPEEGDIRLGILAAGQKRMYVNLIHGVIGGTAIPVGRLDDSVAVDNPESLFTVGNPGPVLPGEYVGTDGARLQSFPERVPDQNALALFIHAGEQDLGAGEPRLGVQYGHLSNLLRIGNPPVPVAGLMAVQCPRVVIDGKEVQGGIGSRAIAGNFAAVLCMVAPVFLSPLHSDRGV